MNLALTSDFGAKSNPAIVRVMKEHAPHPRVAWIPPFTGSGREHFPRAQRDWDAHGCGIEYCDIDDDPDNDQLGALDQYDVIYLAGGDPIGFHDNVIRSGLDRHLRRCLQAGRLVVGASGGSMQLTRNLSLFRLLTTPLEEVVAQHDEYEGLGLVNYELLPHLDRHEPSFIEIVQRYSACVEHDIIALADGAAMVHTRADKYSVIGRGAMFRGGVMMPLPDGTP